MYLKQKSNYRVKENLKDIFAPMFTDLCFFFIPKRVMAVRMDRTVQHSVEIVRMIIFVTQWLDIA